MALSAGTRLGPYEILEPLGAGGMGEVYRAHDEKLDRDIALKILPEGALGNEEARKRFRKEAYALSRLSHPHIATILDFDTQGGTDYLAMELVRGHSLRDELDARGSLAEKTVVRLGAQIAHGLQAAHEQGVIHRDLKPSNLQLTPDGLVKILDFGLARLVATGPGDLDETAPTETAVGRAAGTLPYMSPEQLRGRGVDARADLYALGAVLYELATGRRLFSKESAAELTEAILSEEPVAPRAVNDRLTPGLEAVILKALDKDPELRYQTAKDLLVDLERVQQRPDSRSSGSGPVDSSSPRPARVRPRRWWMGATAVAVVLLAGTVWLPRASHLPRITDVRPLGVDVGEFIGPFWPTWTTDGVRLYYVAREENRYALYHVALSGGEPAEIPTPFGQGLELYGYLRERSALIALAGSPEPLSQNVWLIPLPRGTPRRLGDLRANVVAVSPDDERVALSIFEARDSRIVFVRLDDPLASPYAELRLSNGGGFDLRWSPDGERLRFGAPGPKGHEGESWVWETSDTSAGAKPLWPGDGGAWTLDGEHFVIERESGIAARRDLFAIEERRRLPWSEPRLARLTSGPTSFTKVGPHPDGSGLLAFGGVRRGELQRFNRQEQRFERVLGGESVGYVQPSPDGQWIAWAAFPEGTLWRSRPDGTERLQLTDPPDWALFPVWSPDGTQIAFVSIEAGRYQGGRRSLRLVPAHGGAVEVLAAEPGTRYWNPCWLPDGRSLLFCEAHTERPGILRFELSTRRVSPLEGAENLQFPRGGPQGQILALRRGGDDPPVAMIRRPGEDDWEEVSPLLSYPTWTRDGQAFCGLHVRASRIDCYSVATGRQETLVEIGDQSLLVWGGFPWVGLDAEDNPLVTFDRTTRDLYALDWEAP